MTGLKEDCPVGRLTLIKAAMANIPIYFMSLLNIPKHIATSIEKLQREFLWRGGAESNGMHLVNWETVCSPKAKGGLDIRRLVDMNVSLLTKWLWRLGSEEDGI